MAGERSKIIAGRVFRNLKRHGESDPDRTIEEVFGEMANAVNNIISDSNPDKEITITFKEDQETYPLTTEAVTDPALESYDNNIASVKIVRQPTDFARPFLLLTNKEFEEMISGQIGWYGICSLYADSAGYIHTGKEILGPKNGVNTAFELPHLPVTNSEEIFLNGVRWVRGVDYTIVNRGITVISSVIPNTIVYGGFGDDTFVANYIEDSFYGNQLVTTKQPLIGCILNKRLKVYPIPDDTYEGVEMKLMVYLKSGTTVISKTVDPEADKEWDKAIEVYATAQFLIGKDRQQYLAEFEYEKKRLRPIEQRKQHNISRPAIPGFL